jgi:hypothetical protein
MTANDGHQRLGLDNLVWGKGMNFEYQNPAARRIRAIPSR